MGFPPRILFVLVIASLVISGCGNSADEAASDDVAAGARAAEWSSDESRDLIDFCTTLWLNDASCTRVAGELRDFGCDLDSAYELFTVSAEIEQEPDEENQVDMWRVAVDDLCPTGDADGGYPRGFIRIPNTTSTSGG